VAIIITASGNPLKAVSATVAMVLQLVVYVRAGLVCREFIFGEVVVYCRRGVDYCPYG